MEVDESRSKIAREKAKRAKAIAVEKYKAGDLSGAKEFAVKAKNLDHELIGLDRLNAVLDVHIGFAKKINDEVDWYAVLAVDPTADISTILKRHGKLLLDILVGNDNSVGSIVEAEKILADCLKIFRNERTKNMYDKQREAQLQKIADYEKQQQQQLKSTSHVRVEQPPLSVSGSSGGESKRKAPPSTDVLHVNQLRRVGGDIGIRSMERKREQLMLEHVLVEKGKSIIKPSLEVHVSANQQNNVGFAAATKIPQESETCDAAKKVTIESKNTNDEPNLMVVSVPDSDFYDFDKDRTEASVGENQVWAAFDDYDGMPRFYAAVHSVISREPLKLRISWLNSKSKQELGPMKASGRFSIGRRSNIESINSFSHRVELTKGCKGFLHIYPKKGDVWALYTNWSPSWGVSTPEEFVKKYEMVHVLQDFDKKRGVTVAPLVKVPGYKSVFRGLPNSKTFPKKEILRFSHQVASHFLTGQEGMNAPKGCLELDPAAMPLELLKVFTEKEVENLENVVKKPQEKETPTNKGRFNGLGNISESAGSSSALPVQDPNILQELKDKDAQIQELEQQNKKIMEFMRECFPDNDLP